MGGWGDRGSDEGLAKGREFRARVGEEFRDGGAITSSRPVATARQIHSPAIEKGQDNPFDLHPRRAKLAATLSRELFLSIITSPKPRKRLWFILGSIAPASQDQHQTQNATSIFVNGRGTSDETRHAFREGEMLLAPCSFRWPAGTQYLAGDVDGCVEKGRLRCKIQNDTDIHAPPSSNLRPSHGADVGRLESQRRASVAYGRVRRNARTRLVCAWYTPPQAETLYAGRETGALPGRPPTEHADAVEEKKPRTLRPVTVVQLAKAKEDLEGWTLGGNRLDKLLLVGELRDHRVSTICRSFMLDDGTGMIAAKLWVDTPAEELELPFRGIPIEQTAHFRVVGSLQVYGGKRFLNVTHARLVTDAHEIYYHIMNTIYTHVALQKAVVRWSLGSGKGNALKMRENRGKTVGDFQGTLAGRVVAYLSTGRVDIGGGVHLDKMEAVLKCEREELKCVPVLLASLVSQETVQRGGATVAGGRRDLHHH
uniref:OB domain-containing protein n=1 Tax=Mycena chlorophos TaxID=658473 RepID=A0ABQ0KVM6_MYCCL|nr:predicted protein [Mycena chlorophos]